MTPTLWVSILLGLGGALGALFTVWTQIRDRRQTKAKAVGQIKLDQASYNEIAARAASINSEDLRKVGEFWQGQFDAVKEENKEIRKELDTERRFRRRITKYIRNHEPWDELAENKLAEANRLLPGQFEMPPRPGLDLEEDEEWK